jgi:hypothetical protein
VSFPECAPLAEDLAAKLKNGQLNVCGIVYVQFNFPPAAEIFAGLAGSFRQ